MTTPMPVVAPPHPTCLPKLLQVFLPRQQATNIGGGCLALQSPESLCQALKKRRANALLRSQVLCPVLRAGLRYLGHWGVRKTGVNSLVTDRTVLREKRVRAANNSQILVFGGFRSSSDYYWSRLGISDYFLLFLQNPGNAFRAFRALSCGHRGPRANPAPNGSGACLGA